MRLALLLALVSTFAPAVADAQDAAPAPAPAPAAAPAHSTRETLNAPWLGLVRTYAESRKFAIAEHGDGPLRFLMVGGADLGDLKHPLDLAQQVMTELEAETGAQETFISKAPAPGEIYWLVVFANGDQVNGLVDLARQRKMLDPPENGVDLAKKLQSWCTPFRVYITLATKVKPLLPEWTAYSTTTLAMDAFYHARNPKQRPPTWLREGLGAEFQRLTCKRIKCATVAYEDNKNPFGEDWGVDVAKLIKSGDRQNKSASELTRMPLDALSNVYYEQMWSLCAFVRELCGPPKKGGGRSKLRELLDATAAGDDSEQAIKSVFGKADPALTAAWRQWALAGK